jgi:multisubunit Na+/H+ antiporter MnhG subunit
MIMGKKILVRIGVGIACIFVANLFAVATKSAAAAPILVLIACVVAEFISRAILDGNKEDQDKE